MWIPRCPLLIIIGRKAWCHLHCQLRKSCEKSNIKKSLKNHHSSKPTAKSLLVNSLKEDVCNIRYEKCITKQCRVSSRWLIHNVYSNIPIFSYTSVISVTFRNSVFRLDCQRILPWFCLWITFLSAHQSKRMRFNWILVIQVFSCQGTTFLVNLGKETVTNAQTWNLSRLTFVSFIFGLG